MKNKQTLIQGIIYLVLGILLCVGISGNTLLGWLVSVSLLTAGACFIVAGVILEKTFIGGNGYSGAILLTLGLALLPVPAFSLFTGYFQLIALLMIVLGALYLLDSLVGFMNKRFMTANVIMLVLAALLLTFGFLLWFNVGGLQQYASLILGIIFIIYAVLLIVSAITNKKLIVVKLKK